MGLNAACHYMLTTDRKEGRSLKGPNPGDR